VFVVHPIHEAPEFELTQVTQKPAVEDVPEYVPAGQRIQVASPAIAEYLPISQVMQVAILVALTAVEYLPT
jgi:hypothetical protein